MSYCTICGDEIESGDYCYECEDFAPESNGRDVPLDLAEVAGDGNRFGAKMGDFVPERYRDMLGPEVLDQEVPEPDSYPRYIVEEAQAGYVLKASDPDKDDEEDAEFYHRGTFKDESLARRAAALLNATHSLETWEIEIGTLRAAVAIIQHLNIGDLSDVGEIKLNVIRQATQMETHMNTDPRILRRALREGDVSVPPEIMDKLDEASEKLNAEEEDE